MDRENLTIPGLGSILVTMLLGVVALGATAVLILGGLAANKSHEVQLGWEDTLGPLDEVLTRYPRTEANQAALELESRTAPLGIDIAPRSFDGRERPSRELTMAFRSVKRELGLWLNAQIGRPHRALDAPPAGLTAYLRDHAGHLEAVRRQLVEGEVPVWEMHLDKLREAPLPNLLGHIDLQKLLLADALARAEAGDLGSAARDLEASWRLNLALRDAPILITQLIAVAATRMQAGVLRQLDEVPAVWRDRLYEHDYRVSFLNALRYEGWFWSEAGDPSVFAGELGLIQRIATVVAQPYVQYCLADLSGSFRERVEKLARLETLCDTDLEGSDADLDVPIPHWNLIGDGMVPNLTSAVYRLARLEVDLELTAKLLELETVRDARQGSWPVHLPGLDESFACPDDRWIYEVGGDGTASLALSRKVEWPDQLGVILPTEFRL